MTQPQSCFVLADNPDWAFPDVMGVAPELGAVLLELPDDRLFEDLVELFNHDYRSRRFGLKKVTLSSLSTVKVVLATDQIDRAGRIDIDPESEFYPDDPRYAEIGYCNSLLGNLARELEDAVSSCPEGSAANLQNSPACFLLVEDPKYAFPDLEPIVPGHGAALLELPDAALSTDLVELFHHDHRWIWFDLKTVMLSKLSWAKVVLARRQIDWVRHIDLDPESEYYPRGLVYAEIGECSSRLWELARKLQSTVERQVGSGAGDTNEATTNAALIGLNDDSDAVGLDGSEDKKPQKCHMLAYFASRYAEFKRGRQLSAEQVHEFWNETGFDQADRDTENAHLLARYKPPQSLETFKTYLSKGRAEFDDPRNETRKGRRGRSIINKDDN